MRGRFYAGIDFRNTMPGAFSSRFGCAANGLRTRLGLYPITQKWCRSDQGFPSLNVMREARLNGATPLLYWEPHTDGLQELVNTRIPLRREEIFSAISSGCFDDYIVETACALRDFGAPVFILFAPAADGTGRSWTSMGADSGEIFARAWEHVVKVFRQSGASNVAWVWQPESPKAFYTHLPDIACIDWIGISVHGKQHQRYAVTPDLEELYAPFREQIQKLNVPVLLLGVGMPGSDPCDDLWMVRTMDRIAAEYTEIHGILLESSDIDAAVDRWFGSAELSRIFENPRLRGAGTEQQK